MLDGVSAQTYQSRPMGMEFKPKNEDQTGTLEYKSVTVENVTNFLRDMPANETADLAKRMFEKCKDSVETRQDKDKLKTSDLEKELKGLGFIPKDDSEKKGTGLRQVAVIKNLLNEVKTEARNDQLTSRPKTQKLCEFLQDATSKFTSGKELFAGELSSFASKMSTQTAYELHPARPPAYSPCPESPTLGTAPPEDFDEKTPLAMNPEHGQRRLPEYQPPVSIKLADAPSPPVVAEQTTATEEQMNQLISMVQKYSIQDKKPESPPADTSEQIHREHKVSPQLATITSLPANTVAESSGNWGNRVELGSGLSMTFQTHANHCDKTKPNHLGIRQTPQQSISINKGDLDTSESEQAGMTFSQGQIIAAQNKNDQHFALELGAPGAITYVPKCQLSGDQPVLTGYRPASENYVFCTVKLPTGKTISVGYLLPAEKDHSVPISSATGKEIKGFDFTTRLDELESLYQKTAGASFYDRPENVLSIKITPYWGYEKERPAWSSVAIDYADNYGGVLACGASASGDVTLIPSGLTRGATLASENTFGSTSTKDASASFVLPGDSAYIHIASYQVR